MIFLSLFSLGAISIALGLDAFGVALSLGLDRKITKKIAFLVIILFSFFQFFFVFLGGIAGDLFNRYIFSVPSLVGGIIIFIVGILMIREGLSNNEKLPKLHILVLLVLAISVSIDALVVGFSTFNIFRIKKILFENSIVVGIITALLTTLSFILCKKIRKYKFVKEYADILGGVILIIFGLKMIFF
ncbi:manganese efflux pump MntP family protein [Dethiothermospora halolimnae]|uniref:manganese efflux pump MntP n=1 Tax=Dethiothermospora halolimnae TaxID=3114390 RepID=UPI003CCB9C09